VDTSVNVDPWLRIDGSNSMQANLNVGGNDVVNARDLNAGRNVNATQGVTGNTVWGNTVWGRSVGSDGNLTAGRDVWANASGAGGDVRIANTNNGAGPMSLSGAMQGAQVYSGNPAHIPRPTTCPPGTGPKVIAWAVQINNNGVAEPIGYFSTRTVPNGNEWLAYVDITTPTPSPPPANVKTAAAVYCQP
jgi:hypothetical protein